MTPEGREALARMLDEKAESSMIVRKATRLGVDLQELAHADGFSAGLAHAAELIRKHPGASPWIPVAERLPEQGQHVLALPHHDGIPWPAKFNGGAYLDPVFGGAMVVTHWQPLPAPPSS